MPFMMFGISEAGKQDLNKHSPFALLSQVPHDNKHSYTTNE